jgi:hypothetical protein
MAEMATIPVYACRKCAAPVYVTHLSSIDDPKAEKLKDFMQNLGKIALCNKCRKAEMWYAQQGRSDEFLVNPGIVIYNVVDNSKLDYYGRNIK